MPKKKNEDNRENQKYWEKRARLDKLKVIKTGEQGIDNLKKLLSYNLKSVQRQIKEFYEKYGDNPAENLSYEEFKRYKRKLGLKAKANPQDKTLQRIARQDIPKYRIDRLRALETDLQIMLTEATNGQQRGIYNTLKDVAKVSEATAVKQFANGLDLVFDKIASKKLQKILSSNWSGKVWSDRLWTDRAKVGKRVTAILEEGIPQGFSMQKMTRELQQATGQSFNNAFRLIRTESSFVDSSVRLEEFKQAKEELGYTYYIYDAFLDSRTSEICRDLDKEHIPIDEAEIGVNFPPMHPNCRSTCVLDTSSIEDNLDDLMREKEPQQKEPEIIQEKPVGNKDVDFSNYVESAQWKVNGKDYAGNIIAKDIETAQKIAEQNGVIVANFERMSLEQANEINKALTLLPRGARPDYIADAKTMIEKNQLSSQRGLKSFYGVSFNNPSAIKNTYGKYVEIDYIVGYNTTSYKTFKAIEKTKIEFNKKMAESFAKGEQRFRGTTWKGKRWYFNTQGNATIYHELAHNYGNKKGIPKGFEELGKRWAKESNIGQIQTLSEAWAEAFAGYHINNPELPKYIKDFMKGLKL